MTNIFFFLAFQRLVFSICGAGFNTEGSALCPRIVRTFLYGSYSTQSMVFMRRYLMGISERRRLCSSGD
jgi:hypothetical protein